ncbi:MAG: DUF192 domain-containing protein [Candidatus Omnitrophica bacterium]|nr:DUF192 domain-containing protein [Candidatus Omnitrophota bacterium]
MRRSCNPPLQFLPVILIFLFLGCNNKEVYRKVYSNDFCVRAEVASAPLKREIGLMHRKSLSSDEGMLFVFEKETEHHFWMKNMHIPLDIIWLNADKQIVGILSDVQPCVQTCPGLTVGKPSKYVLEVNAGFAAGHQLKIGDGVSF